MNKSIRARRITLRTLLLTALVVALPLAAFPQQVREPSNTPLDPRPGDGATAAYGILGPETESLFTRIPAAPPHAGEYLQLHRVAASPTNAAWSNALVRLAVVGDDFTIRTFQSLQRSNFSSQAVQTIDRTIQRINDRLKSEGPNPPVAVLTARLERAALADIICHPLESSLVPWALASVRPQIKRPEVKSALQKLVANSVPPTQQVSMDAAYKARLARYATQLLDPPR